MAERRGLRLLDLWFGLWGRLRRFDALRRLGILGGALRLQADARLHLRFGDWLGGLPLIGGGLAGYGDRLCIEALAQGGFDLPRRDDLHVLHHVHVGLQEVPEVVREIPLRLLHRLVGLLNPLYPARGIGQHLVRAGLRLADRKVRLPARALAEVLGFAGGAPAEVLGGLLRVNEGGPDRALQLLELLQALAEARDLLAHPRVVRVGALELVRDGVEEVVYLVGVVAAEAAPELLAPDVYRSNRHARSPRYRSDEFAYHNEQQTARDAEAEDGDERGEVDPETRSEE